MVKSGKVGITTFLNVKNCDNSMLLQLSPKEVIVYVNKVMENLKQAEDSHNHHEVDDLQKERHVTQAENERKQLEDLHTNKLNQLEMEKKSLTQTKEEIEKKILALQTQKSKEEDEFKKKQKLSILAKEVEEGEMTFF